MTAEASGVTLEDIPAEDVLDTGWSQRLLACEGGWRQASWRLGVGLGLCAVYGLAMGARSGGASLLVHAWGVPAAVVAVVLGGLPALAIVLALFDTPIETRQIARCAGSGVAALGLSLAGLAPPVALFAVSSASDPVAAIVTAVGLFFGGSLGLRRMVSCFRDEIVEAPEEKRALAMLAVAVFVAFAVVLAARVWLDTLPLLGLCLGGAL